MTSLSDRCLSSMRRNLVLRNNGIASDTYPPYVTSSKTNSEENLKCISDNINYCLPSNRKHLKEDSLPDFPYSVKRPKVWASLPSNRKHLKEDSLPDFPYSIKRPKVCATRDFRKHSGVLAAQINEKSTQGFADVEAKTANYLDSVPPKSLRSVKCEAAKSITLCNRDDDIELRITANHENGIVFSTLPWKEQKENAVARPTCSEHHAFVKAAGPSYGTAVDRGEEPKCSTNANEWANLSVVPHDVAEVGKNKVKKALDLFAKQYKKLLDGYKAQPKEGKGVPRFDVEAAELLKKEGKWICPKKQFGHIPGIKIGDKFQFRAELAVVGLHCQYINGIDYIALDGKTFATSIVNSGCYENKARSADILIYSGEGGNPNFGVKAVDQKLRRGNLALKNNIEMGYPVRVIYKSKSSKASNIFAMNDKGFAYVYNGLYLVKRSWPERSQDHRLMFKFELHRMPGQPRLTRQIAGGSKKLAVYKERCVVDDVSQGKENMPIHAMNGVDDEKPQPFTYITKIVYPEWCKPIEHSGCDCNNGCSSSRQCLCVLRNRGEIPFSNNGVILGQKHIVFECGPSCRCPSSCMNRVSQHGPRYQLEIFRTKSREWGVRSRNYISSGSFVCEYVGELLQHKEAEQRIGQDKGQFIDFHNSGDDAGFAVGFPDSQLAKTDCGFKIDAVKMGNVGSWINHSSSPNLFAQEVLYDHDDLRMPHIMLFSAKNIPPLKELTCDYNQLLGLICHWKCQLKQ